MNKRIFTKTMLIFSILVLLIGAIGNAPAYGEELSANDWVVDIQDDRVFYRTHGTVVWGHEFGFFKSIGHCDSDTLWLTLSSTEEKIEDFIGKEVVISLDIDGKEFRINLPMLTVETIGATHVMLFTNWAPGEQLMNALINGRYARARVVEPREWVQLIDVKEDTFGLQGFASFRGNAQSVCHEGTAKSQLRYETS